MPVPIVTFGIVMMRASLRPINKFITAYFRGKTNGMGFHFFAGIGHGTHKVETMMNNAGKEQEIEQQEEEKDGKKVTKPKGLSEMQAFNVGIDWFTEIFFFYGILLGVCYWEFNKYVEAQKKLKLRIDNLEENGEKILESLQRIRDH